MDGALKGTTYQEFIEASKPQNMMRNAFDDIGAALSRAVEKYKKEKSK